MSPSTLVVIYLGPPVHDETIEKIVGRDRDGSGYSFSDCRRDMSFSFKSYSSAETAMSKIKRSKKVKKIRGLTVCICN